MPKIGWDEDKQISFAFNFGRISNLVSYQVRQKSYNKSLVYMKDWDHLLLMNLKMNK